MPGAVLQSGDAGANLAPGRETDGTALEESA